MDSLGVPAEQPVYIGTWTNWSQGKILGSTLTLSRRNGDFLVAFIALFVSFVGTSFFRITSFALHVRFSSKNEARDAIHHQRQAVLRNSANSSDSLWKFTQLYWYWRRRNRSPAKRLSPFLVHAALSIAIFSVGGLFSSRISALSGDEVLVSSQHCSTQNAPNEDSISMAETVEITRPHLSARINAFLNQAQDCYPSNGTSPNQRCASFIKSRLPYSIDRQAPCPFGADICQSPNSAIVMDTGLLDSHWDFGVNAPASRRMQTRYLMQCAPLSVENHKQSFQFNNSGNTAPYQRYFYGPMMGHEGQLLANHTHLQRLPSWEQSTFEGSFSEMSYYNLAVTGYWQGFDDFNNWRPIDALQRNDSDVYVLWLATRNMYYADKVDDLWFSAHKPAGEKRSYFGNTTMYFADEAASPLGCTLQYQYCVPDGSGKKKCSPLMGFQQDEMFPGEGHTSFNAFWWLRWSLLIPDIHPFTLVSSLSGEILKAKYSVSGSMQRRLPDNHWQSESERIFNVMLAGLQSSVVDTATGPTDLSMMKYRTLPANEDEKYFCANQKIRSTAYANFSILGLSITFVVGFIILLLNWVLEWVYEAWIKRYRPSHQHARLEWALNGTLQLQRLAHEGIGYGTWTRCDGEIPLTESTDVLATLDLSDIKHPTLSPSPTHSPAQMHQMFHAKTFFSQASMESTKSPTDHENHLPSERERMRNDVGQDERPESLAITPVGSTDRSLEVVSEDEGGHRQMNREPISRTEPGPGTRA